MESLCYDNMKLQEAHALCSQLKFGVIQDCSLPALIPGSDGSSVMLQWFRGQELSIELSTAVQSDGR